MKFNYLELDGKIYFKPEGQYSEVPSYLLFDGAVPGNTYLSYWKVVDAIPQRVCNKAYTKTKYILKEGMPEGMPEGMDKELCGLPDDSLQPCYDKVSWEVPEEDIEVEWVCLGEYNLTPCQPLKNLQTPTPVKLAVPNIAHQAFPCSLSSEDSYKLIL
jgi:hypothetical protein